MESSIGELIRQARKDKGLTTEELGKAVGVSSPTVRRWEKGEAPSNLEAYLEIFAYLGLDIEQLYRTGSYRVLQDYTSGDVGLYEQCLACGAHVLVPVGDYLCPECGADELMPVDVGNGLGGLATSRTTLMHPEAPVHANDRGTRWLKYVEHPKSPSAILRDIANRSELPSEDL